MRNEKGFTLVEIIVSVAIISISLAFLVSVLGRTVVTAAESNVITGAVMLAGEKLALSGMEGLPEPAGSEWDRDERYPRYTFRETVSETPFPGARLVTMDVRHDGKNVVTLEKYVISNE